MDLSSVSHFNLVEPHDIVKVFLYKFPHKRYLCLSDLPKPEIKGVCHWCRLNIVPSGKRKYCSEDCAKSALFYCVPQNRINKAYRFIYIQKCCCTLCGESFEHLIQEIIDWYVKFFKKKGSYEKVHLGSIGYRLDGFDTDHIIPIYKGGMGVGVDNHQVVCSKCHLIKTANERRK